MVTVGQSIMLVESVATRLLHASVRITSAQVQRSSHEKIEHEGVKMSQPQQPSSIQPASNQPPVIAPNGQPPVMQPAPPQQPQQPQRTTVAGIVGLIFGVIGFILSFIPLINNVAAILGVVGVVLGIIALIGTFRNRRNGRIIAILATIFSALAIIITLWIQSSISSAFDAATSSSSTSQSASQSTSQADDQSQSGTNATQQEGDLEGLYIKIASATKSVNDYQGKPTVLVTYDWTNKSDSNASFMVAANAQVFQNGKQLEHAIYTENPEGYSADESMKDLQPGASATVVEAYVLDDNSPITVEVTDLFSLTSKEKVEHTFTLE